MYSVVIYGEATSFPPYMPNSYRKFASYVRLTSRSPKSQTQANQNPISIQYHLAQA